MSETPSAALVAREPADFELHQLLAAPLAALVRAEALSAMALLDVIGQIGFQPATAAAPETLGALRMASFTYPRQLPDGSVRTMTMELPLLSLVPLPVLAVKDGSFVFDVALTGLRAVPPTEAQRASGMSEVALTVALPPTAASGTTAPAPPVMNVHLNVVRGDFPNGIINLLQVMNGGALLRETPPAAR